QREGGAHRAGRSRTGAGGPACEGAAGRTRRTGPAAGLGGGGRGRTRVSADGGDQVSGAKTPELEALQAVLSAEHAAVYGYGVVGGRVAEERRAEAQTAYDAHRARRDALVRKVRDLGGDPVAASAAYALPFPVADSAAAVRLAAELEERVAGV